MPELKGPSEASEGSEGRDPEEPERRRRRRRYDREKDSGDDPLTHARIISRRWEGSVPPTEELYARALRQWQALPGAVVRPATGVEGPPASEDGDAAGGGAE
ncbi:MAG: hypothetical protein JOZ95_23430 [Solirubrobacterales bacterium]|nr:hypothetical protein [Solirubrobacterales bacterium]